jgi:hypothetical protein
MTIFGYVLGNGLERFGKLYQLYGIGMRLI